MDWSEDLLVTAGAGFVSGGVFAGTVTPDWGTRAVWILVDDVAGPALLVCRLPPRVWAGPLLTSDTLQLLVCVRTSAGGMSSRTRGTANEQAREQVIATRLLL